MTCPVCGRELTLESASFCPYCGGRLEEKNKVTGWFRAALLGLLCILLAGGVIFGVAALAHRCLELERTSSGEVSAVKVALSEHEGCFYPGDTARLAFEFYPNVKRTPKLSWSSSDESVAVIDETGRVRVLAEGEAELTVLLENGVTGSVTIKANKKPERLLIGEGELTLKKGETKKLEAVTVPSGSAYGSIEWKSSDPSVAEVDENGGIKAVGRGRATVTAELDCGISASAEVFVYEFGFDILANRLEQIGEVDMFSQCVYFELEHEQEKDQNGLVIHKYTELIWYPEDEIISLCCDVYDEDLSMYYELMVDIYRDERYDAFIWFASSDGSDVYSHTTPLASSGLSGIEAGSEFYLPNYYPGSRAVFQWYEGDEEFRDAAQEIADGMLEYAMITLRDNWEKVGLEQSYKDILYLWML